MKGINDLLKCPGCHRKGTMEITILKKWAEAQCRACDEFVESRVPYPKHRVDHENHQYPFKIGDVRPLWSHHEDDLTCTQEEWEERKS